MPVAADRSIARSARRDGSLLSVHRDTNIMSRRIRSTSPERWVSIAHSSAARRLSHSRWNRQTPSLHCSPRHTAPASDATDIMCSRCVLRAVDPSPRSANCQSPNSRRVTSMAHLGAATPSTRSTIHLAATDRMLRSTWADGVAQVALMTATAPLRSNPPWKTATRSNSVRSVASSRSYEHRIDELSAPSPS
jgi:hypothetical protein